MRARQAGVTTVLNQVTHVRYDAAGEYQTTVLDAKATARPINRLRAADGARR